MLNETTNSQPKLICPYLGRKGDQSSYYKFPSPDNICNRCQPLNSPPLAFQEEFCLNVSYTTCEIYISGKKPNLDVTADRLVVQKGGRQFSFILLAVVATLIVASVYFKFKFNEALVIETATASQSTASVDVVLLSPSETATPFQTQTSLPSPSATPFIQLHQFEVLIQPNESKQPYLAHLVAYGELMDAIAAKYNTTIEAIYTANYLFQPPVRAGIAIVIPVGAQDTKNIIPFEIYIVSEEQALLSELDDKLQIDAEILKKYNSCAEDCTVVKGDVIFVPRGDYK